MTNAVAIGQELRQLACFLGGPIPHHVVTPLAFAYLVIGSNDRVTDALLARRPFIAKSS